MTGEKHSTVPFAFRARLEIQRRIDQKLVTTGSKVTGSVHPETYTVKAATELVFDQIAETMPGWRIMVLQVRMYDEEWV